ncbi:hypothetical protein Nepgr_022873 [Nepenthes gracilis]|uniref:Transmembrane protein n=1 Tax=Nepenthes gracilis TaxID=150966 RepID=A0AAD3XYU1_NEPGR|nr:hypothetical protein Nepgr_022873 [Nepenthes gracilis]
MSFRPVIRAKLELVWCGGLSLHFVLMPMHVYSSFGTGSASLCIVVAGLLAEPNQVLSFFGYLCWAFAVYVFEIFGWMKAVMNELGSRVMMVMGSILLRVECFVGRFFFVEEQRSEVDDFLCLFSNLTITGFAASMKDGFPNGWVMLSVI